MNILEYLLEKNKKFILSSIYQNTEYNGKTLCEYFGVESKTKKKGGEFNNLLGYLIEDLPRYSIDVLDNISLYKKYKDLYLVYGNWYLIKISDLLNHLEKYQNEKEIPVGYANPTFSRRVFTIYFYNKETKQILEKHYKDKKDTISLFRYLLTPISEGINILENIDWFKYQQLVDDKKEIS